MRLSTFISVDMDAVDSCIAFDMVTFKKFTSAVIASVATLCASIIYFETAIFKTCLEIQH